MEVFLSVVLLNNESWWLKLGSYSGCWLRIWWLIYWFPVAIWWWIEWIFSGEFLFESKHWQLGPIGAHPNSKDSANPSLQLRPAVEEAHHWLLRQQTQPGRKQQHRSTHFLSGGWNDHSGESYVIMFWKAIGLDRIKKMHCHLSHLECIWVSPCVNRCHYPKKRKQQVHGFRPSSSHMWCYDIFIYVYDCICSIWVPQVVWFHRSPFKRCARNLSKRTVPWCHCDAARHALNSAVNLEVLKQGYTFTPVIHRGIKGIKHLTVYNYGCGMLWII